MELLGEVPGLARSVFGLDRGDAQVDLGQVAGVVCIAGLDHQHDLVVGSDAQRCVWTDRNVIGAVRKPRGEDLVQGAASEFQSPSDPIAAFGVGVTHGRSAVDPHGRWGIPSCADRARWGRVYGDAFGKHVTGDADRLVRGVCEDTQCVFGDPTGDERITADTFGGIDQKSTIRGQGVGSVGACELPEA